MLIDIYFKDDRPAIVLACDLVDARCERLAGASPGGEKIDQYWLVTFDRLFKFDKIRMSHLVGSTERCSGLVAIVRITGL